MLLLADHVAEFVQRLLHVAVAGLARLRHLQVFQHLLQLFEQRLGGVLVAGARQPLHPLDHGVEVLLPHHPGVGVERAGQLLRIVLQLLGQLAHEIVERRTQIFGELLDLLVAGAALQCLFQGLLRRAQRLLDVADIAVLDRHRQRPQIADHLAQAIVAARAFELVRHGEQAEILPGLRREHLRLDQQRIEGREHRAVLVGVERQNSPLLDQRARQRLGEQPLRQPHVVRFALGLVAGLIACGQRQPHVGAGIGILGQILHGLADTVAGAGIRQHQGELRRLEQRPAAVAFAPSAPLPPSVARALNLPWASVTP